MKLSGDRNIASSENPKSIVWNWVFALVWCGGSFTTFYLFTFRAHSWFGGAIGGIFSLFGIFMLWAAFRMTLEYAKFGEIRFTLQGGAARAGGKLNALVEFTRKVPDSAAIDAELECMRVTWSRGSKGGPSMSEESAWKLRKSFPLRRTATGATAAIALDIPASIMPSDLPGEEPGGSGAIAYRSDIELGRQYYRWEVRIAADVPGLDLERSFPVKVEPASAMSGAADLLPMRAQPALRTDTAVKTKIEARDAPASSRSGMKRWVGAVPMLVIVVAIVLNIVDTGVLTRLFGSTDAPRLAQTANAPQPPAPLPVAWTTPTGGWDMRMPEYAKHAGIAARGIQLATGDNGLRVTFERIVIERNPAEAEVVHTGVALRVRHQNQQGGMGGVASQHLPGKLTADNPVLALENHSFTVAGATVCLQEPCDFYLELDAGAPGQSIQIQTSRTARARGAR